jgi:hypothetical protein
MNAEGNSNAASMAVEALMLRMRHEYSAALDK